MIFQMFQSNGSQSAQARRRTRAPRYHLALEGLEERTVMSAAAMVHVAQPAAQVAVNPAAAVTINPQIHITGINITRTLHNAQGLITGAVGTLTGTIAGQAFRTTATITGNPAATTPTQVLNLHLGPIDLNVLGLEVKTSPICLNISAQPGAGNLLGNLVAGLSNALNGTVSGGGLLGTLNGLLGTVGGTRTSSVNAALNSLLSTVTTGGTAGTSTAGTSSVLGLLNTALGSMTPSAPTAAQNILHLSVGPLNLNLLGLVVNLDNCSGGPVTVDINAIPGRGNLLGNLLASVAHILDPSQLASFDQALLTALGNLGL